MLKLGTNSTGKIYLGTTEIAKAYLGSDLVYNNAGGVTPSYPYDAVVEYLQCSGGLYLVLPIKFNDATDAIEIDFRRTETTTQVRFGAPLSGTSNDAGTLYVNGSGYCAYYNNNWTGTSVSAGTTRHIFKVDYYNQQWAVDTNTGTFSRGNNNIATTDYGIIYQPRPNDRPLFKGNLYSVRFWRSDVLLYDLIPVRVGQVGYMYDKVSGQLFGNSGTGSFTLGNDIADGYTLLGYVDNATPITFDTGVAITSTHTWEVDSHINRYSNWATWIYCWDMTSAWRNCDCFIIQRNNAGNDFIFYLGNVGGGTSQNFTPSGTRITQGYDGTKYYCGTFTKSYTPKDFNQNWSLKVRSQRIYSIKIWNNGTLVNNFVPVMKYNVGTGVNDTGMYDTVTSNFIKIL